VRVNDPAYYPSRADRSTGRAAELSLVLPIPPSINHQYATVNGRRLLSAQGRSYKALVGQEVMVALSRTPGRVTILEAFRANELALCIRFFFTSRLRRDVDGGLKIAQDALCQGLGINDNRIVETHLYKHVDKASPRMEIRLCVATQA
jgi:crossover junction endodeoxyribonuclease RusA